MIKTTDIDIAKKLRDDDGYTIAAVKDGKVIYKSKEKGILPLYLAFDKKINFNGASVADKVVGKGAAILMAKFGIGELHSIVISQPAIRYLHEYNIVISYAKLVDYISNRNGDGKCPVETMAEASSDFGTFIDDVRQFLKRLELI